MKSAVLATTVALASASSSAQAFTLDDISDWAAVHDELTQCLTTMAYCSDVQYRDFAESGTAADVKVELNFKTKSRCLANSMYTWNEPVPTAAALKEAVEAYDASVPSGDDLVLLRRTASIPVNGALVNELKERVPGSSVEGYLRCGNREYVYLFGDKAQIFSQVGTVYETIGSEKLVGFDMAMPVPSLLRLSPYLSVQMDREETPFVPNCGAKSSLGDAADDFLANIEPECGVSRELKLKLTLPQPRVSNGRTLADARADATQTADRIREHLVSGAGRKLLSSHSARELAVTATSSHHIQIEGMSRGDIRSLLTATEIAAFGMETNVIWIEPVEHFVLHNYDASLILQTGTTREPNLEPLSRYPTDTDKLPFWRFGVTGKDQIVGVGDSGLAIDHCMFEDPSVNTTAPRDPKGPNVVFEGHRKIVNYNPYADGTDDMTGSDHGTHVAGTVAGSLRPELEASLRDAIETRTVVNETAVLYSMLAGHRGVAPSAKISFFDIGFLDSAEGLDVPDDIANDYLQPQYDMGSRVQTNSWGVRYGNYYSESARGFDRFMFEHQDFVSLISAGNSAFHRGSSGSLGSPSSAKNVVSVGASMTSDVNIEEDLNTLVPGVGFECGRWSDSKPCESGLAYFTSNGPTFDGRIAPDVVAPGFVVHSADSQAECGLTGKAGTSMACPATAGSLALTRQYLMDGYYPSGEANPADGFTPMGALLKAIAINSGQPMTGDYARANSRPIFEGFPEFGTIPITTGDKLALTSLPNHEYGFGLVKLDATLKLKGHTNENAFELFLDGDFDNMSTLDNWQTRDYRFDIPSGATSDIKVTLVWHDPVGAQAARTVLVNDLDLEIIDSKRAVHFPNDRNHRDDVNNVEQTIVKDLTGSFTVRVIGRAVPLGPQPYALVVRGTNFVMKGEEDVFNVVGKVGIDNVVGEVSRRYYGAWAAGGVAIGSALVLFTNAFLSKRGKGVTVSDVSDARASAIVSKVDL